MSKNSLLLSEVITKYHPAFLETISLQEAAIKYPDIFNVEMLIEECYPTIGPYTRTDDALSDFSDLSDSKTSRIRTNAANTTGNTYAGEIRNVSTLSGNDKVGALRCIIYNPHRENLLYYFLPKAVWTPMICRANLKTAGIPFLYHYHYNDIPKFVGYECDNFEELALAMDS